MEEFAYQCVQHIILMEIRELMYVCVLLCIKNSGRKQKILMALLRVVTCGR